MLAPRRRDHRRLRSGMKTARGALDFDDLIVKTTALLSRSDAAQWVQYKLDRGVEHILVDEAQDTSPRQWQVVKALVEEFFAGEGASGTTRTLFAVGDEKQSIFSFQGAVPAWFSLMRRELGSRAPRGGSALVRPRAAPLLPLGADRCSRRSTPSSPAPTAYRALSDVDAAPVAQRRAPRRARPRDLWPMIEPAGEDRAGGLGDAARPSRRREPGGEARQPAGDDHRPLAARRRDGSTAAQPIRAGGILILCRTRGAQTDAINRALKSRGVPIAGADRLHADRAHRGHGPDGARPRGAAAGGRPVAGGAAQEPADRARRGRPVRPRPRPQGLAVGRARRARREDRADFAEARGADRRAGARSADYARALRLLRPHPRARAAAAALPAPARRRGRGRARRVPRPGARLRAGATRRRCRASSPGSRPAPARSSATPRRCATRCG